MRVPVSSYAQVVMTAEPFGWPSARPQTWYEAEAVFSAQPKSVGIAVLHGSWNTAPFSPRPIGVPEQS